MRKIILLGASGSIGRQTIDIIKKHRKTFDLVGFSVGNRVEVIDDILCEFKNVKYVVIKEKTNMERFKNRYPHIKFNYGNDGLTKIIEEVKCDMVVNALVGFVGFLPTIKTLELGIDLALANKESLVVGGKLVNNLIKKHHSHLYPIDSEHVALAKCLKAGKKVDRLIITASGGAFRDLNREQLKDVTVEMALKHPSWQMGNKITIDCATMMNKGFEIIEAYYLFNFPLDKIDVLLHDESHIHSLVEFNDGSYIADIGPADMRIPISYALFKMKRVKNDFKRLPIEEFGTFHFRKFNPDRYPCVGYAREALTIGGTMPAVVNAANEEAVYAFLNKEISFLSIERIIKNVMQEHNVIKSPTLSDLLMANDWAREQAKNLIKKEHDLCI